MNIPSTAAVEAAAIVEVHPRVELGVIRADGPAQLVKVATEAADALRGVISKKKLFSTINGREYVRVEGWTTLATMMGCLPREVSVSRDEKGTYTATVELVRMGDQAVLTRASAECGMDEPTWAKRQDYARRSMAVTRATSKACRIAFSWVMVLAGYEVTPAEEIPDEERGGKSTAARPKAPAAAPTSAALAPTAPPTESLNDRPRVIVEAEAEPAPFGQTSGYNGPAWPCGKFKGTPLNRMTSEDLLAQRKWAEKTSWVTERFTNLLDEVDTELAKRQGE